MHILHSPTRSYFLEPINQCSVHDSVNIDRPNIFTRYLEANADLLESSKYIYFMDDDLLGWKALLDIPLPYAIRLWRKATSKRKRILSSCSELWVSTPYLAQKYSAWNPRLIRPIASGPLLDRPWIDSIYSPSLASANQVRICYHGTWSHRDDMKWLAPIISEVQRRCPNTIFEVIGGDRVARIFKGIPRVSVLPTMSWPDYLKHTQTVRQDIGLAPLRDTLFNRGRGPIKFFDYSRAGAVGVYSAGPAFSEFVSHKVDGYVLHNDQEIWVNTIVKLVNSPELRQQMAHAAWLRVLDNSPTSPNVQNYLEDLNEALMRLSNA